MIADIVGLFKTEVNRIVSDYLHIREICAKFVSKILIDDFTQSDWSFDK